MATITAAAGGGNWTTGGTWVGGVAPTAADDAVLASTSGNVTIDSGAVCRSLDCNGYTGTLTHTAGVTLSIGDGTAGVGNRALRLSSGMTYTLGDPATSAISFVSTSATQQTVDYAGKTVGNQTINGVGGSWILSSAITTGTTGVFTVTNGAFNANGQTINVGRLSSSNSNTRTVNIDNCVVTLSGTGAVFAITLVTNLTFSNTGCSVFLTNATSTQATFASAAALPAFPFVSVSGGGGPVRFTGGNKTFTNFTIAGPKMVETAAGLTLTFTNPPTINAGFDRPISFLSLTPGSTYTFSCASGTVLGTYLSLIDCIASGGATFIARSSFSNNTTGWTVIPPRTSQSLASSSYALYFPNTASYDVVSSSNSGVSSSGSFTLACRFRLRGYTGTRQDIFGVNFTPTNTAVSVSSTGLLVMNDPIGVTNSNVRAPLDEWVTGIITWDSVTTRAMLYFDGFCVFSRTGTPTAFTDGKVVTGRFPFSSSQATWGNVGQRRIWARDITLAEALAWSQNGVEPATTNLRVRYDLLTGSGTTDFDTSGNGNNGAITSAPWVTDRPVTSRQTATNRQSIPAATIPATAATGTITVTDYQYLAGKETEATVTVTDYTAMTGGTLNIGAGLLTVVEGVDFNAVTSNNQTADNLAAALLLAGVSSATVNGASILIGIPGDNDGVALTWDTGGLTPTSQNFSGGFDVTRLTTGSTNSNFGGAISIGASNSDCATNIAARINTTEGAAVTAAAVGNVVTVTYDTAGTVGNSWAMSQAGENGGTISNGLTLSGATLSGGAAAITGRNTASNRVEL